MAGVDGCRGGWVVVTAPAGDSGGQDLQCDVVSSIAPLLDRVACGEIAVVAIDMPIGLPDRGPRACDVEARRRLGPRGASVFPAPVRAVLHAVDQSEASRLGRAIDGRGVSIQTFNIIPKIRELDETLGSLDTRSRERVLEAHPESTFASLADGPLTTNKRSLTGRHERVGILRSRAGIDPTGLFDRRSEAQVDDVLDAAVLIVTARRWLQATATVLGDGTRDRKGRPMRIVI